LILLGIETSGKTASAAVCNQDGIISQTSVLANRTHSQIIMPIVKDVLRNAGLTLDALDGFTVSVGPGSYTGLRIGIAAVKAFGYALEKKCAGISTLESLAYNLAGVTGYIRPVMKARGELAYTALFESDGKKILRISNDEIRPLTDIAEETAALDGSVMINGDGAELFAEYAEVLTAPPQLRLQLASSLCYACFAKGDAAFAEPCCLNADYMEATKAEKELAQ